MEKEQEGEKPEKQKRNDISETHPDDGFDVDVT